VRERLEFFADAASSGDAHAVTDRHAR